MPFGEKRAASQPWIETKLPSMSFEIISAFAKVESLHDCKMGRKVAA